MKNKKVLRVFSTSFLLGTLLITNSTFAADANNNELQLGETNVKPPVKASARIPNSFKSPLVIGEFDDGFDFTTWFINNYVPATGYKDTYNNYDQVRAYTVYSFKSPEKDSSGKNKRFDVFFGVDLFNEGTGTDYENMNDAKHNEGNNAFYKYSQATGDLGHIYYKDKLKYTIDNAIKGGVTPIDKGSSKHDNFDAGMMFSLSSKFTKPTVIPSHNETFMTKEQYLKDYKTIEKGILDKFTAKYGKYYEACYIIQSPDDYNGTKQLSLPSNMSDNFTSSYGGFQIIHGSRVDEDTDKKMSKFVTMSRDKYDPYDRSWLLLTDGTYKGDPNLPYKQIKKDASGKKQLMEFNEYVEGKIENPEALKKYKADAMKLLDPSKVTMNTIYTYVGNVEKTTKETPYKTIKQNDPTLKKGETKVKVKGVKGKTEILKAYEVDRKTGKLSNPKDSSKVISKPVDEVILVGTMTTETKNETKTEPIKFAKKTRENPTLEKGQSKVVQKGQNGEKTITYKVTYEAGKEIKREKISEKVTKEPIDEITEVGTLVKEIKNETKKETIKFTKETKENIHMLKGETKVVQKGVDGEKTLEYKVTYENGKEVKREKISEKVTKQPVKEIIEVGTLVREEKEEKKTEPVKFETEHKENPNLEKGQSKVIQKGADGIKELRYKVTYENGKETKRELIDEKVTKEPVKEIIEVGTLVREVKEEVANEEVKFETEHRESKDLEKGHARIAQKGQLGSKELKYKVTYENGKEVKRELIGEKVTKEPIKEIIEIGIKVTEEKEEKEEKSIKFETKHKENPKLEKGKSRVVQKGAEGIKELRYKVIYENGKEVKRDLIDEKVTKEPIDEIIEIGTLERKCKCETKVEKVKFETEHIESDKLEKGHSKITQKGVDGEKTYVYKVTYENGKEVKRDLIEEKITKEPIKEIIEIGTKEVTPEPEKPVLPDEQKPETKDESTQTEPEKKDEEIDAAELEESFTKEHENLEKEPAQKPEQKPEQKPTTRQESNQGKKPADNNYQQIEQAKKPEPQQNKTPEKMPKAGIENETMLLVSGALSTIAGLATLKKKRK